MGQIEKLLFENCAGRHMHVCAFQVVRMGLPGSTQEVAGVLEMVQSDIRSPS